ncbi:HAD family phosphatase [Meridianimarinicoccus sp. MJW13]|uniref:HAD family hydrolase n=1 Tax=Meridianimarinicoccus sp. MJW13 TaxID=2720031 RepID=UPI0018669840|nr:HAD-IA family hydrolase [Fluviibacterium sp. MJW13]
MPSPVQTAALLFDLDGTLLHSDPLHAQIFIDLFAARGVAIDDAYYLRHMHGRLNEDIFTEFFPDEDAAQLSWDKEAAFRDRLGGAAPATAGVEPLLARARADGLGLAVVTNAPRINAEVMLAAIGLADAFDTLVIGDECDRGKPHPDPYLAAMAALNADPARCIAFEDSPSGVHSAAASGAYTVGLESSLDADSLRDAGAAMTIKDFTAPALGPMLDRLTGARP